MPIQSFSPRRPCRVGAVVAALILPVASYAGLLSKSSPSLPTDSKVVVSQELIDQHKGDFEGFMKAWLGRARWNDRLSIWVPESVEVPPGKDRKPYDAAAIDSVRRFCTASGGLLSESQQSGGTELKCSVGSDELGVVHVQRMVYEYVVDGSKKTVVEIRYKSNKMLQAHADQTNAFAARLASNGPTGWVETADKRFKVLRFGDFSSSKVFVVEYARLEDLRRLEFLGPEPGTKCCKVAVTGSDGSTRTVETENLGWEEPNRKIKWDRWESFHIVTLDDVTNRPYVQRIPLKSIKSVVIDSEATQATALGSPLTVDEIIRSRRTGFENELKSTAVDANGLARDKVRTVAGSRAIEGQPGREEYYLPEKLVAELIGLLDRIVGSACRQKPSEGLWDINAPLRCDQARREMAMLRSGAPVTAETTPLSILILADKD